MEITSAPTDGSITVHFTKADAIAVLDDLGAIDHRKVSQPGDKLHSLLGSIHPEREPRECRDCGEAADANGRIEHRPGTPCTTDYRAV